MITTRLIVTVTASAVLTAACAPEAPRAASATASAPANVAAYAFSGGYPTGDSAHRAFDELDLNRAVHAYRFFYPTVASAAIFAGSIKAGMQVNHRFGYMDTQPRHAGYTLNSDTPYGGVLLDLHDGPMVIELPAGQLIGAVLDVNQRWIADMGLPGTDAGRGGKHLLLPPGYAGAPPAGYLTHTATSYRIVAGIRSIPVGGDLPAAIATIKTVKVYPLQRPKDWQAVWFDMTPEPQDTTPNAWIDNFEYWKQLHAIIDAEPPLADSRNEYGELAALGIVKGQPFAPDARMTRILEQAAKTGSALMRVESFGDRRPDRIVWADRKWEWASLRFENGSFDTPGYRDTYAMDKWFFQAIATSPAMFRRDPGAGSLYWLGLRDASGAYFDGGKTYKLTVPLPVPNKLFWSVTVYDAETRSQIATDQAKAALRSLFELKSGSGTSTDLFFGPSAPAGQEGHWIKTIPGKGWFVYFRIYGPERAAFDGSWKPADFVEVR